MIKHDLVMILCNTISILRPKNHFLFFLSASGLRLGYLSIDQLIGLLINNYWHALSGSCSTLHDNASHRIRARHKLYFYAY